MERDCHLCCCPRHFAVAQNYEVRTNWEGLNPPRTPPLCTPLEAQSPNVVVAVSFPKGRNVAKACETAFEAHFWLKGYVNKQNCRIWSEANPQVYVETPLHPEKLTVWCALWAGGILLQKRRRPQR
ncbi:hypothetical protein TNCV_45841 [Trichonephila clavipes]|nr:hypothetical protein TNCV_45841 [Trichonephila clavipes]